MTRSICHIKSSGVSKSCWYLDQFWTDSHLVTGSCTNLFQGAAVTDYMERSGLNVTRWVIPCTWVDMLSVGPWTPGRRVWTGSKRRQKWKFNELGLDTLSYVCWILTFFTLLQDLLFFQGDPGSLFCLCSSYKMFTRPAAAQQQRPCTGIKLCPSCSHICIYFVALMVAFNFPQFPLVFRLSCIKKD